MPTTLALPETQPTPPPTYSIIFDNLDFFLRTSHQFFLHSNQNIHWIHHIAVQDRIPTHHITNEKTVKDILQYDLATSLPGPETQNYLSREFIVVEYRMLCRYLSVFQPFSNIVVHHMPHQYSKERSQWSTDVSTHHLPPALLCMLTYYLCFTEIIFLYLKFPLGLLFKDKNKTTDLVDVLRLSGNEHRQRIQVQV